MRAKKVAILESRLGAQLADLVAQRGGVPFHAPALAELPDLDPGAIGALLRSLEERPAKAAVFQTGVGTRALFGATDADRKSTRLNSSHRCSSYAVFCLKKRIRPSTTPVQRSP